MSEEKKKRGSTRRRKEGREGEASTVDQLPLSPTSAMTRSLTPPRLRGRNLTYITAGQGLSWDLSSNHDTPPGSRLPATSFVLYHVPALRAANGHARVPALTHVRRKDADCPPVSEHIITAVSVASAPSDAPHRSTWTRHVLASTMACTLRSAVHILRASLHTALHQQSTPHSSARTGWQGPTQTSPEQLAATLFRR